MAAAFPLILSAIQGIGTFAAAHPLAVGAATGALSGAANGGGWEGALKGAALGGLGSFAGGALGDVLGRVGSTGASAGASEIAKAGAGKALGATAGKVAEVGAGSGLGALSPEIAVYGTAPTALGSAVAKTLPFASGVTGGALAPALTDKAPRMDVGHDSPKPAQQEGNSWGEQVGNTIGKTAVGQAFGMMGPNVGGAPGAPAANASPFAGGGASPAPPAGLSIKGSTAPNIYPWKAAA